MQAQAYDLLRVGQWHLGGQAAKVLTRSPASPVLWLRSSGAPRCLHGALRRKLAEASQTGRPRVQKLLLLLLLSPRLAATAQPRRLAELLCPEFINPVAQLGFRRNMLGCLCLGAWCVAMLMSSRRQLSLSGRCHQLEPRKGNLPRSVSQQLYFDTHAQVCLLEANGFTIQQAEIIVLGLVKMKETNMDFICKVMVSKMQQEIALHQIISKTAHVKKDMIILEKSKFSALRAENEKIKLELHQLKQQVMYSLNEKKMLELRSEIVSLHAQKDRALMQTDRKIETKVAGLKTMLEAHKLDTIKYLAGSVFTLLTVALGFYRL